MGGWSSWPGSGRTAPLRFSGSLFCNTGFGMSDGVGVLGDASVNKTLDWARRAGLIPGPVTKTWHVLKGKALEQRIATLFRKPGHQKDLCPKELSDLS